jgi:hypothetical protein
MAKRRDLALAMILGWRKPANLTLLTLKGIWRSGSGAEKAFLDGKHPAHKTARSAIWARMKFGKLVLI